MFTNGLFISNGGFSFESGNKAIFTKEADAIGFGSNFITNPDLVERCRDNTPLRSIANVKDMSKLFTVYFYMGGAEGYTNLTPYEK